MRMDGILPWMLQKTEMISAQKGSRVWGFPPGAEIWSKCSRLTKADLPRPLGEPSAFPGCFQSGAAAFRANPSERFRMQPWVTGRGKPRLIFHIQILLNHHKYCLTDMTVRPSHPSFGFISFSTPSFSLFNWKSKIFALQHHSIWSVLREFFHLILFYCVFNFFTIGLMLFLKSFFKKTTKFTVV